MQRKLFDETDLEITHYKGSGPGGQNRNKRMTGIRIRHIPTGLVVTATERRSQEQNLQAAYERLEAKLTAYYHVPKKRKATKKTRSSQVRRVENKLRHSATKRMRTKRSWDD